MKTITEIHEKKKRKENNFAIWRGGLFARFCGAYGTETK